MDRQQTLTPPPASHHTTRGEQRPYRANAPGIMENLGDRIAASFVRAGAGALDMASTPLDAVSGEQEKTWEQTAYDLRDLAEEMDGEAFLPLQEVGDLLSDGELLKAGTDIMKASLLELLSSSPEWIPMAIGPGKYAKAGKKIAAGVLNAAGMGSYAMNRAAERAGNDGRDRSSAEDVMYGTAAAVFETFIDKAAVSIGAKALFGKKSTAERKAGKLRTAGRVAGAVTAGAAKGAAMEGSAEGFEYLATHVDTQKGVNQDELVTAAAQGALVGGPLGGMGGLVGGSRKELARPPAEDDTAPAAPAAPAAPTEPGAPEDLSGDYIAELSAELAAAVATGDETLIEETRAGIIEVAGETVASAIFSGADTLQETTADLTAQVQAVEAKGYGPDGAPTGVKSAVFSELRDPLKAAIKGVDDWGIFKARDGGFYAAPKHVHMALKKLDKKEGEAGRAAILGYSTGKPAAGAPAAVVQGKDKQGNVVQEQVVDPTDAPAAAAAVQTAGTLGDTVEVTTPDAALGERAAKLKAEAASLRNPLEAAHIALDDMQNEKQVFDGEIVKANEKSHPIFKRMDKGTKRREPRLARVTLQTRVQEVGDILSELTEPLELAAKAGIDTAPVAALVNKLFGKEVVDPSNGSVALLKQEMGNNTLGKRAKARKGITGAMVSEFMFGIRQAVAEVAVAKPTKEVFVEPTTEAEGAAKTATGATRTGTPAPKAKKKAPKKKAAKKKSTAKKTTPAPAAAKPTAMEVAMAKAKKEQEQEQSPAPKVTTKKKVGAKGETLKKKAAAPKAVPKKGTLSLPKKKAAAPKKEEAPKAAALKKKASKTRVLKEGSTDKQIGAQKENALKVLTGLGGDQVDAATRLAALRKKIPALFAFPNDGLTMTQIDDLMELVVTGNQDVSVVGEHLSGPLTALREAYDAAHAGGTMANQARALTAKARGDKPASKGYTKQKEDIAFLQKNSTIYNDIYDLFKGFGMESQFIEAFRETMASGSADPLWTLFDDTDGDSKGHIFFDFGIEQAGHEGKPTVSVGDIEGLFNVAETINMHLSRKGLRGATTEGSTGEVSLASVEDLATMLEEDNKAEAERKAAEAEQAALDDANLQDLAEGDGPTMWGEDVDPNDYEAQQGYLSNSLVPRLSHAAAFPIAKARHAFIAGVEKIVRAAIQNKAGRQARGDGKTAAVGMRELMKDMLTGLDANDPLRALAERLLDRGDLNFDVEFARAEEYADITGYPIEKVKRTSGTLMWNGGKSKILINADRMRRQKEGSVAIMMHEIVHAYSMNMLYEAGLDDAGGLRGTDAQIFAAEVAAMRGAALTYVGQNWSTHSKDAGILYGLSSNGEFLAEAMTNRNFQILLSQIPYEASRTPNMPGNISLWKAFKNAVWAAIGGKANEDVTLLDEAMRITMQNEQNSEADQAFNYTIAPYTTNDPAELTKPVYDVITSDIGWEVLDALGWADTSTRSNNRQNTHSRERVADHAHLVYGSKLASATVEFSDMVSLDGKTLPAALRTAKKGGSTAVVKTLGLAPTNAIESTFLKLFEAIGNAGNALFNYMEAQRTRNAAARRVTRQNEKKLRAFLAHRQKHSKDVVEYDTITSEASYRGVDPSYPWMSPKNAVARKGQHADRNKIVHAELRTRLQALSRNGWVRVFRQQTEHYTSTAKNMRALSISRYLRATGLDRGAADRAAMRAANATTKEQVEAFTMREVVDGTSQERTDMEEIRAVITEQNKLSVRSGPPIPIMRTGNFVMQATKTDTYTVADMDAAKTKRSELGAEVIGMSFTMEENADGTVKLTATEKVYELHEKEKGAEASREDHIAAGYTVDQIVPKRDFGSVDASGFNTLVEQTKRRLRSRGGKGTKEAIKSLDETTAAITSGYQMRKSSIRRKNVAGGDIDQYSTMARHIQAVANASAEVEWGDHVAGMQDALISAGDRIAKGDTKNGMMAGHVINELLKRQNAWREESGKVAAAAGTFGFIQHLASPSYSIINSFQPLMTTYSVLSGEFAGPKAMAAMQRAYKAVGSPIFSSLKDNKFGASMFKPGVVLDTDTLISGIAAQVADPEMKRMLQAFGDEGIIEASLSTELYQSVKNTNLHGETGPVNKAIAAPGKIARGTLEFMRMWPHYTEVVNRSVSAMAAFELAIARGDTYDAARNYAAQVVRDTQFDYSGLNRPRWLAKNDLLKTMGMFKIFPLSLYGLFIQQVLHMGDKATRRKGARTLAYLFTTHAVFAGAAGSVMMEPIRLALIALGLAFDDDEEVQRILNNPDVALMEWLEDVTGSKTIARAITYGAPTLVGANLYGRIGLHSMLVRTPNDSSGLEWVSDTVVDSVMGPVFGYRENLLKFSASLEAGNTWQRASFKYLAPKAARDLYHGTYMFNTDGMTDFNGNVIRRSEDFDSWDSFVRGIGFATTKETDLYRERSWTMGMERKLRDEGKALRGSWRNAKTSREKREINRARVEFNRRIPPEFRKYKVTMQSLVKRDSM